MKNLFNHSLLVLALSLTAAHATGNSVSGVNPNQQTVQLNVTINGGNVSTTCAVTIAPLTMNSSVSNMQSGTVYSLGGAFNYSDCTSGQNILAHGDAFTAKLRGANGNHILEQVDGITVGASTADINENQNLKVDFYLTEGACGTNSTPIEKITITRDTTQQYSLCSVEQADFGDLQDVGSGTAFTFDVPIDFTNI